MIYPIVLYGEKVLRQKAHMVPAGKEDLQEIIENMFETLTKAIGVGLSAPQVGISLRLFVVKAFSELDKHGNPTNLVQKSFINPIITEKSGEEIYFNEGCLSFPGIYGQIKRREKIAISYYDEKFNLHEETFGGFLADIIQHEYDHLNGMLFIDYLSPIKKKILVYKLKQIMRKNVDVPYPTI